MLINEHFSSQEYERPGFLISTDPTLFNIDVIHRYLANESYWSPGIAREKVERYIQFCLCFGVYAADAARFNVDSTLNESNIEYHQVGFARVVSDFTLFAYLADVFILPSYRGRGLGKWLVASMLAHPELQNLRTWTLYTQDAHGLYAQFGFLPEPQSEKHMVYRPNRPINQ